jgi:hypothetical protein
MRALDPNYADLRAYLEPIEREALGQIERERIEAESGKNLPVLSAPKVIGLIVIALVVGFGVGRWYEHSSAPVKKQLQLFVKASHG